MTDELDPDALSVEIERLGLPIGLPLTWSSQTESTNSDAVEAAKAGAPHGAMFLADMQTAGRGRLGRSWLSPSGQNLMLSLVLRPTLSPAQLSCITLALGLGVADAVAKFVDDARVGIKWPNDIFVGSKKVAGILVEGAVSNQTCEYVVAGIGLNVSQRDFEPSIASVATSLALESNRKPNRSYVLVATLSGVAARLRAFDEGGLACMLRDLAERDVTRGHTVRSGDVEGVADGIESDGRLRIRVGDEIKRLHVGDVKFVH